MCKSFNWTTSAASGTGHKVPLDFLGIKKDAGLPKCVFSKRTYGHSVVRTKHRVPGCAFLSGSTGRLPVFPDRLTLQDVSQQQNNVSTCWGFDGPNFLIVIVLKLKFEARTWHRPLTQMLIDQDTEQARHQQYHQGPLFISKPEMPCLFFSKIKSLLNSIQIAFPSWKGHTQWKLWMCRGPLVGGSGGPAWLGTSRSNRLPGQFRLCSAATTGDMEDPFGSLSSDLLLVVCSVM